jgi:DNA-binding NarL/FixJ family response regulator
MSNESLATLWSAAPANSSLARTPSWECYSQVSVGNPIGYSATAFRSEVREAPSPASRERVRTAHPSGTITGSDVAIGISREESKGSPWSLTQRELDVLQLLAEGATNSEISARLFISPKTTKNHLAAIFQKLDVTNRTHALVRAVVMGLVTIE